MIGKIGGMGIAIDNDVPSPSSMIIFVSFLRKRRRGRTGYSSKKGKW